MLLAKQVPKLIVSVIKIECTLKSAYKEARGPPPGPHFLLSCCMMVGSHAAGLQSWGARKWWGLIFLGSHTFMSQSLWFSWWLRLLALQDVRLPCLKLFWFWRSPWDKRRTAQGVRRKLVGDRGVVGKEKDFWEWHFDWNPRAYTFLDCSVVSLQPTEVQKHASPIVLLGIWMFNVGLCLRRSRMEGNAKNTGMAVHYSRDGERPASE